MSEREEATILPFTPAGTIGRQEGEARDLRDQLRMVEAILFASAEPVSEKLLADRLPDGADLAVLMSELQQAYVGRGVNVVKIAGNWAFRTADDLGFLLQKDAVEVRKLSRAALEVLATIAYHQPVTRAEVEEVRGVATSKGTLDVLLETGWVRMRGRRKTPGRPVTYGTTDAFLDHFGLSELRDLPGMDELKGAGLLSSQLPMNFQVPLPADGDDLTEEEEPFTPDDLEELGLLPPGGAGDDEA
ncbi:MAG: SMC-Scp complex subunit ScpB [Nitratireductor sp.]|nr:SMC-Scp complex subunit ScpB [Nitratireductor sp.]